MLIFAYLLACAIIIVESTDQTCRTNYSADVIIPDNCIEEFRSNPALAIQCFPKFNDVTISNLKSAIDCALEFLRINFHSLCKRIEREVTWSTVFESMETYNAPLEYTFTFLQELHSLYNSEEVQSLIEDELSTLANLTSEIATSRCLFNATKMLREKKHEFSMVKQRIIEASYNSFIESGIELPRDQQLRLKDIEVALGKCTLRFQTNVMKSTGQFDLLLQTQEKVKGLPQYLLRIMYRKAVAKYNVTGSTIGGPWLVTLDNTVAFPVLMFADDRSLREKVYMRSIKIAGEEPYDNSPVIEEMRSLYQEKAALLGYSSYTEFSLSHKMAANYSNVMKFIEKLSKCSFKKAHEEIKMLKDFALEKDNVILKPWDLSYYLRKFKEDEFKISKEEIKGYFPKTFVIEEMLDFLSGMYNIKIVESTHDYQTYSPDVKLYDIFNNSNTYLGSFYFDIISRPGRKQDGSWMSVFQTKSEVLHHHPISFLSSNTDTSETFNLGDISTIFHEMGHTLQALLTKVKYSQASGINLIEWDAVEFPSQYLEAFIKKVEIVSLLSSHVNTSKKIGNTLLQNYLEGQKSFSGLDLMTQLKLSAFDLEVFRQHNKSWYEILKNISVTYSTGLDSTEYGNLFPCSFSHIFGGGYTAGYYSYKWAEVMALDAADYVLSKYGTPEFKERALHFKKTILETGGSRSAAESFREFRGRDPSEDALMRHYGILDRCHNYS